MLFAYLAPGDDYTKTVVAKWEADSKHHTNKES